MRAPALFELDDADGHSTAVAGGEVPAGQEGPARAAALGCPERAIGVS
jgi:ferredoxin